MKYKATKYHKTTSMNERIFDVVENISSGKRSMESNNFYIGNFDRKMFVGFVEQHYGTFMLIYVCTLIQARALLHRFTVCHYSCSFIAYPESIIFNGIPSSNKCQTLNFSLLFPRA